MSHHATDASPTGSRRRPARPHRPTMADVAARVGVSRALVSLVFRNQPGASSVTRERILQAAAELGYRPDNAARMLARGRSRTIGVLMNVRQPFHADLVEVVYREAERHGYDVLLSAGGGSEDEGKAVEALLGHRCEALILLRPYAEADYLDQLGRNTVVVVVGRRVPGDHVHSVHTADGKGVRQAVNHLVRLGHERIVHVDGGQCPGAADRRRAYRAAMRRHGLDGRIRIIPGAHHEDAGIAAGRMLLAEPELPTAVLAGDDRCALGLMHTLGRAGVDVPGQLSVIGYDDSHLAHLSHIDLTSIRHNAELIGAHAVGAAVERLCRGGSEPGEVVLEPELVVRGTTGPPPR